jgi:TRAP-type uncharacterized transport system substrate-binding protein
LHEGGWKVKRKNSKASGAPAAKWVSAKDILNFVTPVHPGAAKYYREIGIQVPDSNIWKKK